jgi:hypothetical protein
MDLERLTLATDDHRRVVIQPQKVDPRGDDRLVTFLHCTLKAMYELVIRMVQARVATFEDGLEVESVFDGVGGGSRSVGLGSAVAGITGSKLQARADLAGRR